MMMLMIIKILIVNCIFEYLFWLIVLSFFFFFSVEKVIYRDFKSSNVLLDEDFHPKLSDFGLAREGPQGDQTHVSTAVSLWGISFLKC